MTWWAWWIIGFAGWVAGAWITTFLWTATSPKDERFVDYSEESNNAALGIFFFWPICLVILPIVRGARVAGVLLTTGVKAGDKFATYTERQAELRRLRAQAEEAGEERVYPIPHTGQTQRRGERL